MTFSLEVFTTLLQFIERSQNELIQNMKQKQKTAETKVGKLIKELEMEISKLHTKHSELEKLSCSEDHLQLIQVTYCIPALTSAHKRHIYCEHACLTYR